MRSKMTVIALAAAAALSLGVVGCGGSGSSVSGSAASSSASAATSAAAPAASAAGSEQTSATTGSSTSAAATEGALTADQLAKVDVTIALDDYEAMKTLSDDIQNFRDMEGKVVQIDGYVSNFSKGMSYNIVQNNPQGSGNIGTVFVIDGASEDSYPSDGTHVLLTGKVGRNDTGSFLIIHTLPEFVVVQQ